MTFKFDPQKYQAFSAKLKKGEIPLKRKESAISEINAPGFVEIARTEGGCLVAVFRDYDPGRKFILAREAIDVRMKNLLKNTSLRPDIRTQEMSQSELAVFMLDQAEGDVAMGEKKLLDFPLFTISPSDLSPFARKPVRYAGGASAWLTGLSLKYGDPKNCL